jgi:hypothetical protein
MVEAAAVAAEVPVGFTLHYLRFGLRFAWARSLPATVFSFFVDFLFANSAAAWLAALLPVAIKYLLHSGSNVLHTARPDKAIYGPA